MAKVSWKASLTSSREKTGSPDVVVQVKVAEPPLVRSVGVLIVRALANGAKRAIALRAAYNQ